MPVLIAATYEEKIRARNIDRDASWTENHVPLFLSGETISGQVAVSCDEPHGDDDSARQQLDLIEITLEGQLRTVITRDLFRLERHEKVLNMIDCRSLTDESTSSQHSPQSALGSRGCHFHFVIPDKILALDDHYSGPYNILPPSLRTTAETVQIPRSGCSRPVRRGECDINYHLRFRVFSRANGKAVAEMVSPIHVLPSCTETAPPVCVADFPGEYMLSATKIVNWGPRRRLTPSKMSKSTGRMALNISEPAPLVFIRSRTWASTTLQLSLEYTPPSQRGRSEEAPIVHGPPPLPSRRCGTVKVELQATTFFSVTSQNGTIPLKHDATINPWAISNTSTSQASQVRKFQFSPWKQHHDVTCDDHTLSRGHNLPIVWLAHGNLVVPYERDQFPIPTFASTFVSRRYRFKVNVAVDEPTGRTARFTLLVPVQIVYQTSSAEAAATAAADGPLSASIPTNNGQESIHNRRITTAAELEELQPVDEPPPAYTDWRSGRMCVTNI